MPALFAHSCDRNCQFINTQNRYGIWWKRHRCSRKTQAKKQQQECNIYHDQRTIHSKCTYIGFSNATKLKLVQLSNSCKTQLLHVWFELYRYYYTTLYCSVSSFCFAFFSWYFCVFATVATAAVAASVSMYVCCIAWRTMTSLWFTHLASCDFFHDYTFPLKCRFYNEY